MYEFLFRKKVIVFGSNGYIGSHLVHFLAKHGANIYAYDIDHSPLNPTSNYLKIDFANYQDLRNVNWNVDAVFIFTGRTGTITGFNDYIDFITINEIGLLNVLTGVHNSGFSPRIVYPSSRLVYRGSDRPIKENDEKEAMTVYAVNKLACEQLLRIYQNTFGLEYTIYRICIPYGHFTNSEYSYGTIGFFINQAINTSEIILYGDGSLRRSLTYIWDICNQIVLTCFSPKSVNEIYNLLGEEYSLSNIAYMISEKYQVDVKYQKWPEINLKVESGHTIFDGSKIKNTFNLSLQNSFINWLKNIH